MSATTTATSTTRTALDAAATARQQHQLAGRTSPSHHRRLLNDDDFRVGSYVVHSPPSLSVGNRISLQSGSGRGSNIPGYQFKTKLADLTLESGAQRRSTEQNGLPTVGAVDTITNTNKSRYQQHPFNHLSNNKSASVYSSPPEAPPLSPSEQHTNHHQPQAIPRWSGSKSVKQEQPREQQISDNTMGDRLSSPLVVQQQPPTKMVPSTPKSARVFARVSNYEVTSLSQDSGDYWATPGSGQQSPTKQLGLNKKFHYIRQGQTATEANHSTGTPNNRYRQQQTPRLPRGVSKIPHQVIAGQATDRVNAHETAIGGVNNNEQRQRHYHPEESAKADSGNMNRYLTFSKDQATSHFKSLRDELGLREIPATPRTLTTDRDNHYYGNIGAAGDTDSEQEKTTTSDLKLETSPMKPVPLERHLRSAEFVSGEIAAEVGDNNLYQPSLVAHSGTRQQPICEAFIMTGDSIVKKSCTESENNNNTPAASKNIRQKQFRLQEERIKSFSLNKLNQQQHQNPADYLSVESIAQKVSTRQLEQQEPVQQRQQNPAIESTFNCVVMERANLQTGSFDSVASVSRAAADTASGLSSLADTVVGPIERQAASTPPTSTDDTEAATTEASASKGIVVDITSSVADRKFKISDNRYLASSLNELDCQIDKSDKQKQQARQIIKNSSTGGSGSSSSSISCGSSNSNLPQETNFDKLSDSGHQQQQSTTTNTTSTTTVGNQPQCDEKMEDITSQQQSPNNSNNNSNSSFDRDSARRLAKRLYNLSGFKRSDVCHHLVKSNPFSQMVAEEYVNLFDFRSMKLDAALRKFLSKLQLNGETQERERMLSQFSQRYYDCNKDKFPNADTVQTLVCALILLNTDLHGGRSKKKRSKLSLGAFIDGLNSSVAALSSPSIGYTFPRHLLIDLYEAIKKRPLKSSDDKCDMTSLEAELDKIYNQQVGSGGGRSNTLPTRRFAPGSNASSSTLSVSARRQLRFGLGKMNSQSSTGGCEFDAENAIQFKSGYLNRKRVFEGNGKATSKGRRSWRRVYVILQDLRMIMQLGIHDESKQQQQMEEQTAKTRAQAIAQSMKNSVKIHHTIAKRSTSYTKRDFVFHLRLSDQSEFLLQANDEQDMQSWIDTINFATACLSSPALPSAVSNLASNSPNKQQDHYHHQLRTQKPLLPVAYTKLSYWEQLIDHEDRLHRLRVELDEHLSDAPNTRSANKRFKTEFIEKIAYLKQEIERYTIYVDLMRKKSNSPEAIVLSKHPYIASLTPSDEMIKSLPSFAPSRATPKDSTTNL